MSALGFVPHPCVAWIDDVAGAYASRRDVAAQRQNRTRRTGGWLVLVVDMSKQAAERADEPSLRLDESAMADPISAQDAVVACAKLGRRHARALALHRPVARTAAGRASVSRRHSPLSNRSSDALVRERSRLRMERANRRRQRTNRHYCRGYGAIASSLRSRGRQ